MHAQEQYIPTNYYEKKILKQNISENFRLCANTLKHLNIYSVAVQYIERHNKIGSLIYFNILGKHGIKINKQRHEISNVFENNDIKMIWNLPITTKTKLKSNKPDLICIVKKHKQCTIFDFSLPWDSNIDDKYKEKVSKYLPLASEIKNLWLLKEVTIQPIIIGCTGSLMPLMKREYEKLQLKTPVHLLQSTAVYESCKIIRSVINIE